MGQGRRHQGRMGAADRHLREIDLAAAQAIPGLGDHIAVLDLDLGAELLKRHDEQVDRARADGAAAGQGHLAGTHAGEQRRHDPEARAHLRDELIRGRRIDDFLGLQMEGLAGGMGFPDALAIDLMVDAVVAQDAQQQVHISQTWKIFQRQGF